MKQEQYWLVVLFLVLGTILSATWVEGRARAQTAEPWILFGHDVNSASTVTIDTQNGLARRIGPMGFQANQGSSLASARADVPSQGGLVYPAGSIFGILRDSTFNKDYVVVIRNDNGEATKTVELDLGVGGRGAGFGADGKTLYTYYPPGILLSIDTVTGAITHVGDVEDSSGTQIQGVSLEWDHASGEFISIGGDEWNTVLRINPQDASATIIGTLDGMNACTITRVPGPVAGPGGTVFPEGTWFTVNNITDALHALTLDTVTGTILDNQQIGFLGPNASFVCGTAFALPETPWSTPTHPGYPYPGPTPEDSTPAVASPTPTATAPATATATFTRIPSATVTPEHTATPSFSRCVCPEVRKHVPQVIILDALANPERYFGWQVPLDAGKPPSPANPPRECLTLQNVSVPRYHPMWNKPIWRVGCP